ncbi:MAG TPA: Mur ligase domain-containing protein, partial [Candidatus Acidoferrum sp.]|nr:Mur ligase domain-containing protein [Candidatus Acidoferrum sp.]
MTLSLTQESERKTASNETPSREASTTSTPSGGTRPPVKLAAVLKDVEADSPETINGREMRQLGCDSRKVQPGSVFFALHGAKADGNAFVKDAVARGAVAIVSEERQPADLPEKVLWIR